MRGKQRTFIVHLTITIYVGFSDHLIHLFICQLLAKVCHDMTQLCSTDVAITVLEGIRQYKSQKGQENFGLTAVTLKLESILVVINKLKPSKVVPAQAYLVKYPKRLTNLFLAVCVFHFPGHHRQELWEIYGSIS